MRSLICGGLFLLLFLVGLFLLFKGRGKLDTKDLVQSNDHASIASDTLESKKDVRKEIPAKETTKKKDNKMSSM